MTVVYIIAILLQACIIIYFLRKPKKEPQPVASHDTSTYEGVRKTAIGITPDDLKLKIPDDRSLVYGVVMDWDMGASILTLAAYITGAANVYLSSGPGITGGGKDPEVAELAVAMVTGAQEFIQRAIPVPVADYPARGCVRFYLLTNHGIYAAQEQLIHIEDTTSPWLALFIRGNTLINEMKQGAAKYN